MRSALYALIGALLLAACTPVSSAPQPPDPSVRITLERTVCFGFCPDYSVTITGDGQVTYDGHRFVAVKGQQHGTASTEEIATLLQRFDSVNFMSLRNEYRAPVTDLPTYTVTLQRGGRTKRVADYGGLGAGMPDAVRTIEEEIDRVANTARWVRQPNGEPVRAP